MSRAQSELLPITWDGFDEAGDVGDIQFYDVIFSEDFGPWKKGEKLSCLTFLLSEGCCVQYTEDGESRRVSVKVKLIPA